MERKYEKLSPWATPASVAALTATYAAQSRIRNIPINRGLLAAAILAGIAGPQIWNSSVAAARSDAGTVKRFNKATNAFISADMLKHANWFTAGLEFIGRAAADTGRVLVTKPTAVGDKTLRAIAISGLGYGGYKGAQHLINSSKSLNYKTYERNLALHGKMSPNEMSASGFKQLLKTSALEKVAISPMLAIMGAVNMGEVISAGKKAKAPMLNPALKSSQTINSSVGMNNFK